jgi:ribosomal protein L17
VTYKQIHGCAMGSPVVANLCMEVIENTATHTTLTKPKTWKRFVDDSFSIIKKTAISTFHNTLNNIDPNISFTIEFEQDNQISFLDALITRQGNNLEVDVYRK